MAALLLDPVGGPRLNGAAVSTRFDVRARSRQFLRRGLILSGALHLALLYAFLHLPGSRDDALVRSYDRPIDLFRRVDTPSLSLPPDVPGGPPASASKQGVPEPVPDRWHPDFDFSAVDPFPSPNRLPNGNGRTGSPDAPGALPAPPDNRVYLEREVDVAPVAIRAPKPPYPDYPREIGLTDRVVAEVLVRTDGTVAQVRILSGNKLFIDSVQETLYRWTFRPAMVQGHPVAVWVEIPVNFTL